MKATASQRAKSAKFDQPVNTAPTGWEDTHEAYESGLVAIGKLAGTDPSGGDGFVRMLFEPRGS